MIILASQSPRRKQLLEEVGLKFITMPSDVDETIDIGTDPLVAVCQLAERKATAIAIEQPQSVVIGSDTIVVVDDDVLGKPSNAIEAKSMLRQLSGRTHYVHTAVSIVTATVTETFVESVAVTFYSLTDEQIDRYIASGEPFDKAGSYGIQGQGRLFVETMHGDYFAVVGLPVARTVRTLATLGLLTETILA